MKIDDLLSNVSRTDVLRAFGLGPRARDYVLPAVGLFSTGVLLGAGLMLLFAPKSGAKLREDISDELHKKVEDMGKRLEHLATRIQGEAQSATKDEDEAERKREPRVEGKAA